METKIIAKKTSKRTGQFANIEEAVKFKNDELMKIFRNVDMSKLAHK